jgi:hypothetical protein
VEYQKQRIFDGGGPAVENLEGFLTDGFILMDDGRRMEQQWLNTANFSRHVCANLQDWIADLQQSGRIRFSKLKPDPAVRKKLQQFGVTKSDPMYLIGARQFGAFALVSEDSDMFDPKLKTMTSAKRNKAKRESRGVVCRYARKTLRIEVTIIEQMRNVIPKCADVGPAC